MSWELIKELTGDYAIRISGWENGLGLDPYSGMNVLNQVNTEVPGEVSVGYPITSSTITSGTVLIPIQRAVNTTAGSPQKFFILTSNGSDSSLVFASDSSTTSSAWSQLSSSNTQTGGSTNNQGLTYWKGYLFRFRSTNLDYNPGGSGSWTSGWKGSGDGISDDNHYAMVGTDDVLYFCNGRFVGSIIETAGSTFDPTNSATYTFNARALAIPVTDLTVSLAEQGTNLLVGGSLNAIYPWNRIDPTYTYPIFIGDNYIRRMVTVNTNVYIFPGNFSGTGRGRIFVTNGSQADEYLKIPDYITGVNTPYFGFSDAIYHRNNLIFGFQVLSNASGAVVNGATQQVWAIDLETKALRSISTVSLGSPRVLLAGSGTAANEHGFSYITGYSDGSSSAIGYSGTTSGIGTSTVRSELIPVGTFLQKKTYTQVEVKLRSPLQSGESVAVAAITESSSDIIGTFNETGQMSKVFPITFQGSQWLQIDLGLTGNSATSGVRIHEVRIR